MYTHPCIFFCTTSLAWILFRLAEPHLTLGGTYHTLKYTAVIIFVVSLNTKLWVFFMVLILDSGL